MKNILFITFILLMGLISAADFTPQGDIDLRDIYNIENALAYDGVSAIFDDNVTASYFIGDGSQLTSISVSTANSSDYWDNYNTASDLNNLITIQGENISGGTISFARLPTLTNMITLDWANITNKFITAVDNSYIYMSGTTTTLNETKLNNSIQAIDTATNTSMKNYVDTQDTTYNNSMKTYVDNINSTQTSWTDNFFVRFTELVSQVGNFSAWDKDYSDIINTPTVLSNFSDDLGDRGYTSNLNFTNDAGYYNSSDFSIGDYSTTSEIVAFGYYNSTDFVITDYFTKAQIDTFGYYNSSDFSIADYFTSAEVLAFNYYNSTDFNINDYVTSSTLDGFNYYNSTDFSIGDYYTSSEIDGFNYYNSTDFSIGDYYLKSNPFNFYNSTTIPSYILNSNEGNLDVNSANYWDSLNSPSDIGTGDITDEGTWRLQSWDNFTGIPTATPSNGDTTHLSTANQIYDWVISLFATTTYVDSLGNWSNDKSDYWDTSGDLNTDVNINTTKNVTASYIIGDYLVIENPATSCETIGTNCFTVQTSGSTQNCVCVNESVLEDTHLHDWLNVTDRPENSLSYMLSQDLVAQYIFNNDDQTDSSDEISTNTGTYNGYTFNDGEINGATLGTGKYGNAYEFDGTDDNIELDSISQITYTGTFSIGVWFNSNIVDSNDYLFSQNNAAGDDWFGIALENQRIRIATYNDVAYAGQKANDNNLNTNTWYHMVYTYDNGTANLYLDGIAQTSEDNAAQASGDKTYIGVRNDGNGDFNGSIDEVRIWDKALTQSEIQAEMDSSNPVKGDGLISSYSFEQNTATHTLDTNNLVQGKIDKGARFDGVDDYIDTGLDWINGNQTISMWIKTNTITGTKGDGFFGMRDNSGGTGNDQRFYGWLEGGGTTTPQFIIGNPSSTISGDSIGVNTWSHIVLSYNTNNNEAKLYQDNILKGTVTKETRPLNINYFIGGLNTGGDTLLTTFSFNGSIDDVRIYNRTLSEDEIKTLYNSETGTEDGRIELNYPNLNGIFNTQNNWISGDGDSEGIMIDDSGNVGIGTDSPDYKLDINSGPIRVLNEGGTSLRIAGENEDTTIFRVGSDDGTSDLGDYGFSLIYMGSRSGNDNSLSIFTDDQTEDSQLEAVTILQDGNVGIGTDSPSYPLEINGDVKLTGDNDKIYLGDNEDASIYYNGTNLIISG